MKTNFEKKQEANKLRSMGKYDEALKLYLEIYPSMPDEYVISGILQCFRKQKLNSERLQYVIKLIEIKATIDWSKYELKKAIFSIVKEAKAKHDWKAVNEWIVQIPIETLNEVPFTDAKGRPGWNELAMWYHYRILGLIEIKDYKQAENFLETIKDRFPKQRKFFKRLRALLMLRSEKFKEAKILYKELISIYKDWWILQEYAQALYSLNEIDQSLTFFSKSALMGPVDEMKLSIINDIGIAYKQIKNEKEALIHFLLIRSIRDSKGWRIPEDISENIKNFSSSFPELLQLKKDQLIDECKKIWNLKSAQSFDPNISQKQLEFKTNLRGTVLLDNFQQRQFCNVASIEGTKYFCFKSDLPNDIENRAEVIFDIKKSFDKRGRESWKAINIRKS